MKSNTRKRVPVPPQQQLQNFEGARLRHGYSLGPLLPRGHMKDAYSLNYLGSPTSQLARVERRLKFIEGTLEHEHDVYKKLRANGFATGLLPLVQFLETKALRALILPNVGPSIAHLLRKLIHFSPSSVNKLAAHCVSALKSLHSAGFVHGAVCPQILHVASNVQVDDSIYLTDFSYAFSLGEEDMKVEEVEGRKGAREIYGRLMFASARVHEGGNLNRVDDLISLGYVLVACYSGGLPWFNEMGIVLGSHVDTAKAEEMKKKISLTALCSGVAPSMKLFFKHVEQLALDASPDYELLRSFFLEELPGGVDSVVYDWVPS